MSDTTTNRTAGEPPHRRDIRLWLARHKDDETVLIHVGRIGYGTMTVAELRAELGNLDRGDADLPWRYQEAREQLAEARSENARVRAVGDELVAAVFAALDGVGFNRRLDRAVAAWREMSAAGRAGRGPAGGGLRSLFERIGIDTAGKAITVAGRVVDPAPGHAATAEVSAPIPGYEGSVGPGPGQYGIPHVYARDVASGAGNCVCGRDDTHRLHVPVPASPRGGGPL